MTDEYRRALTRGRPPHCHEAVRGAVDARARRPGPASLNPTPRPPLLLPASPGYLPSVDLDAPVAPLAPRLVAYADRPHGMPERRRGRGTGRAHCAGGALAAIRSARFAGGVRVRDRPAARQVRVIGAVMLAFAVVAALLWRGTPPLPAPLVISGSGSIVVVTSDDGRRWLIQAQQSSPARGEYVIAFP